MDTAQADENNARSDRTTQMETIVAEHETALLSYASRILNNPFEAQDVVQNVFVKLFQGWKKGTQPSSHLRGWLFRATHNEAVDHIRRESRLRVLHEKQAGEDPVACTNSVDCEPSVEERRASVLEHLQRLHPREQQIVVLRLEQGMSYAEISEITGRSAGNVGNILHHAVKKLTESLKRAK
jgi:RNA polymerase sigma-70 factor (ECF subfamily)